MRLQSAVFYLEDALLTDTKARAGADKVLSILKMESVWMFAVSASERSEAEKKLRESGLSDYFRGILTAADEKDGIYSAEILRKAMRRLHSSQPDTVIFAGAAAGIAAAKEGGFRAVAVGGMAGAEEWQQMSAAADYTLVSYDDWFSIEQA